ncbi:MAG: flagellar protein FlgN [Proteobacteria bacterium]|nr:flagellar protein FlgN [Pseudomonadota bacterium]MBU1594525.1 flagellar protein FlgN [Pseudomonadota bacterium]
MLQLIQANLSRQVRALELLSSLQEEEFAALMARQPQEVSSLELSVQDLMRQLVAERLQLRRFISAGYPGLERLRDVLALVPAETAARINADLADLDRGEQVCAMQADKNRQLVLGLFDQSMQLLTHLHKSIQPNRSDVYGKRGRFTKPPQGQASFFSGRL